MDMTYYINPQVSEPVPWPLVSVRIAQHPDRYVEPKGIIDQHHVEPALGYVGEVEQIWFFH